MVESSNNTESKTVSLKAKKDHIILQNDYKLVIKKGDDLSKRDIPKEFIIALKTEKVI